MELKSELLEEGYIKEAQVRKTNIKKVNRHKTYEPHYILIPGKGKIGFGMNGLQNEELTFNIAKKDDIFLHVKDYPGSHVVILEGKENHEVMDLALELCLYLSHLQEGEIYVAKRKNVKKNPTRVGLVNILQYEVKTLRHIRASSVELFRKELKAN